MKVSVVYLEGLWCFEAFFAHLAFIWRLAFVHDVRIHVACKTSFVCSLVVTLITFVLLLTMRIMNVVVQSALAFVMFVTDLALMFRDDRGG